MHIRTGYKKEYKRNHMHKLNFVISEHIKRISPKRTQKYNAQQRKSDEKCNLTMTWREHDAPLHDLRPIPLSYSQTIICFFTQINDVMKRECFFLWNNYFYCLKHTTHTGRLILSSLNFSNANDNIWHTINIVYNKRRRHITVTGPNKICINMKK